MISILSLFSSVSIIHSTKDICFMLKFQINYWHYGSQAGVMGALPHPLAWDFVWKLFHCNDVLENTISFPHPFLLLFTGIDRSGNFCCFLIFWWNNNKLLGNLYILVFKILNVDEDLCSSYRTTISYFSCCLDILIDSFLLAS